MTKKEFIEETEKLIDMLKDEIYQITIAISGNKASAQRARVASVEISKQFKIFREDSMDYITRIKKADKTEGINKRNLRKKKKTRKTKKTKKEAK